MFTDLDGSLMEHESYSITAAAPALAALRERQILMVLNSSKTAAEMQAVQTRLSLTAPFVCENGAALFFPNQTTPDEATVFGALRDDWLPQVHALRKQHDYPFEGFADWNAKQVSELTGLEEQEADLARQRQFSEPILWRGAASSRQQFEQQLAGMDLSLLEGGRFLSIQGQHDKSNAMTWLRDRLKQQSRDHSTEKQQSADPEVITVALGDSPNDAAMLEAADVAVIIKSAKSDRITLHQPNRIIRTSRPGPAGWKDAMLEILQLLDSGSLAANGS
ncbi:MAG: mannosyl-3-phosphoglycerate phosphatase-related protein [Pseudohongiellaceae bacterium]